MLDWIVWVMLIAALVIGGGVITWKVIQVIRMKPEEREEIIKQWLVSAVVAAESAIKESGAGQKKMEMVMEQFQKKAPIIYKLMMKLTKNANLKDLINKALTMVKENFEK